MITIIVNSGWLKNPKDLAKRLNQIVQGSDTCYYDTATLKWHIGGNMWFMYINEGTVTIKYNYHKSYEFWAALKLICENLLNQVVYEKFKILCK